MVLIFCFLSRCYNLSGPNFLVYLMLPLSQIGFELFYSNCKSGKSGSHNFVAL